MTDFYKFNPEERIAELLDRVNYYEAKLDKQEKEIAELKEKLSAYDQPAGPAVPPPAQMAADEPAG